MLQIFRPSANRIAKLSIAAGLLALVVLALLLYAGARSSLATGVGTAPDQPVPYSHALHAGELGLDCRYCHTSVDLAAFAGIPANEICMNCHTYILPQDDRLAPIRASFRAGGKPVQWAKVYDTADFCYFNHSVHLAKGVGCVSCHGRVDQMAVVRQQNTLLMEWCLDCHRHPERYVRPRQAVFSMTWEPSPDQATVGRQLVKEYQIENKTSCSICHR